MRIKLIMPKYSGWSSGSGRKRLFPNLTLAYLAALTPQDWEVVLHDECEGLVDFDEPVDLVGISTRTYLAPRAFAIAKEYRKRNIPVVMGGIHPTVLPEETLRYADTIVVGEAELVWDKLLKDFRQGNLKKIYKADHLSDLENLTAPRYDLLDLNGYLNVISLFTTRGCPFNCSYCSVSLAYGKKYRKRSIDEVIDEIIQLKENYEFQYSMPTIYNFADDNIWENTSYAKELFKKLVPLKIMWLSQGSVTPCMDRKLLELAAESGCQAIEIGFETLHPGNLLEINKHHNKPNTYYKAVNELHSVGISVIGSFMLGLPKDDFTTFETIYQFVNENNVELPSFAVVTPFPGTRLFEKLDSQNKLLSKDWSRYDFINLLFEPQNMTREEFKENYIALHKRVFSEDCIERRLKNCGQFFLAALNHSRNRFFNERDFKEWIYE